MPTRTISNAGGNWSSTGTWVEGAVPTSADDVRATATSGNLTLNTGSAPTCSTFDLTGYVGSISGWAASTTLTIAGNLFRMATGMTFTPASASRLVTFTATSGSVDIYTNGQTLGAISFTPASGGATFNIRDTLTTLAASNTFVHITAGSVVSNGNTLNIGGLGFNGAATRSLDISGSTVNITGTGGTAFTSSGTNQTLTMDANTVINFTYVGATDSTMNSAAGQTFPTINVSTNSGGAIHNFLTASATNVNIAAGRSIGMNSTAKTWTNLTALGTNANPIYFTGTSGTPTQLNVTNSNVNYVIVQNVANNGNTIYDYGGSTTDGSNTGWLYPAFPGGGTALLMGV